MTALQIGELVAIVINMGAAVCLAWAGVIKLFRSMVEHEEGYRD